MRREPWVQPITTTDLYAYLNDVLLIASSQQLIEPIATAQPPAADGTPATSVDSVNVTTTLGSNGWAIGSALTETGRGMLLGNPHFPWEGENRLWESQLTLTTGELNVYGSTISGVPGVLIGFNDNVAWTHTTSAGYRMTLYSLDLVPGDPTSYRSGDSTKQMTSKHVTIEVKQADGSVTPQTRTMWSSHYGPMVNLPFGWTGEKAYTMRDANIDNTTFIEQFLGMDASTSLDEFIDVHRTANGIPWVNTMAVSADGRAWYADTAATPNLSPAAIAGWQAAVASGGLAKVVLDNGAILLDGSDPTNEWVDDPASSRPGITPFSVQPQLERSDFVFNANDSHWLANPAAPLTGFSPLTGPEGALQSARTRENATLLTDPVWRGADGKFSLAEVQAAIMSNHSMVVDLLLPQLRADCVEAPPDLAAACAVIAGWDGEYDIDSVGAALFREFLAASSPSVWGDEFSAADPIGTPSQILGDRDTVLGWLRDASTALTAAGHAIDAPLGDLQFDDRAGVSPRIGLGGGQNIDGTASILECCANGNTTAPQGDPGTFGNRFNFTELGYPVSFGDSFMITVAFGADGPEAAALLTYGQTDDTTSPAYTEQMQLLAAGEFRPVLFTAADIAADPKATTVQVTGD